MKLSVIELKDGILGNVPGAHNVESALAIWLHRQWPDIGDKRGKQINRFGLMITCVFTMELIRKIT